ncbi:MAG: hypothetical protein ACK5IB_04845 [Qingshengfaniella sp.]
MRQPPVRRWRGWRGCVSVNKASERSFSKAIDIRPVYRIVVFVPDNALEAVIAAITACHALTVGRYDNVLWYTTLPGVEQFSPRARREPHAWGNRKADRVPIHAA